MITFKNILEENLSFKNINDKIYLLLNNKKIGYIEFSMLDDGYDIGYLGINKKYRNMGYGVKLLTYFKNFTIQNNKKYIFGDVTSIGSFNIMRKIFGKPKFISNNIKKVGINQLKKQLSKYAIEDKNGTIDASNDKSLVVCWEIQ